MKGASELAPPRPPASRNAAPSRRVALSAGRRSSMPYERAPRLLDLFDVRNLGGRRRAGLSWAIQLGFLALLAIVVTAAWMSYAHVPIAARALGGAGVILTVLVYRMVRRLDRLRSEAAREAAVTHERFRVTLGSIGDAVLVTNEAGRLTFCNAASHSLLADPAAAIGRPLDELFAFESEATGETRRRSYRITPGPLSDAMEWMVDVGATWDSRLGRLKRLLERR